MAEAAAVYPPQLCRALLRGIEAQRRCDGASIPKHIASELDRGRGLFALAPDGEEGEEKTKEDDEGNVAMEKGEGDDGEGSPPMSVDPSIEQESARIAHEEQGLIDFVAGATQTSCPATSGKRDAHGHGYWDHITGEPLPPELARAALVGRQRTIGVYDRHTYRVLPRIAAALGCE